ncbi:MAG: alanine racemase [Ruminococcus sp.]|nr:alanine racemase [Ruminococcus sp.]
MELFKRCWAEIDLSAVEYNLKEYKKLLPEGTELMCVVKAACYGHDDSIIVPVLQNRLGVRYFAVSNLLEGRRLRDLGVTGSILILGYTPPENTADLISLDLIQACTEKAYAEELSERAAGLGRKVRLHCAVDTGMTRIGVHGDTEQCAEEIAAVAVLENISLEGIFTHYACADGITEDEDSYTRMQTRRFFEVFDRLKEMGICLEHAHILNSAGGAYGCSERSTLARLGIILYGLYPDPAKPLPFEPKPVMTLKAVVSQVKYVEKGTAVSYGRTYTAPGRVKLATVTAGYADGYPRALSNKGQVIIGGHRCRITGRVCMDQFMCDVTDVPEVKPGNTVILMNDEITADDIAKLTGTIGYEITCGISSRVIRTAK